MTDRTTLVIAHRLSTVLSATRILVLAEGQVDAIGVHEELRRDNKIYGKFANLQFIDPIPNVQQLMSVQSD